MTKNVTEKLIADHLVDGEARAGEPIALRVDQTLTQDATGTLVMLELEAMGVERATTELSVQYVDHNLLQQDQKNADDHRYLASACRRFGVWFSPPGNGVSHPVHQEYFGRPGATLLGSDSHTPAAGALAMLAIGAGGLNVASAMAGRPFRTRMPEVWGVRLDGALSPWVSAKDVILELLRRHGVRGGVGRVLEYYGPGVRSLSVWDRHVIANMGTELGATTSVFPSDEEVRRFLSARGRAESWRPYAADEGARFDVDEEVDLGALEPLIAMPSSPGNVVPVREVAGRTIGQSYLGSSANPGYRDFAIAAQMVRGRRVHEGVSFDLNPATRTVLQALMAEGHLAALIAAGGRLHQTGCNGCIGMGQAPASGSISLRTVPRNFPGRSGTREDAVCLVSPETATASALRGEITDPRDLGLPDPEAHREPPATNTDRRLFAEPLDAAEAARVEIIRGANIRPLPQLEALPASLRVAVLLEVGDDISTDEILPAGARVLPLRSNIEAISAFAFEPIDSSYAESAAAREGFGHAIVAGHNYGQGSSREHAALAPRYLGLRLVLARSFARIHRQNLINFGVLPLTWTGPHEQGASLRDHTLRIEALDDALADESVIVHDETAGRTYEARHDLDRHERAVLRAGGVINHVREQLGVAR